VSSNDKNAKLGQKRSERGFRLPNLEFWEPPISRERLKLETSNLARRQTAVSSKEKKGHVESRDPMLEFWDP